MKVAVVRRAVHPHRAVYAGALVAALLVLPFAASSASAEDPTPPTEAELSSLTLTGADGTTRVWQAPADSVGDAVDSATHLLTAGCWFPLQRLPGRGLERPPGWRRAGAPVQSGLADFEVEPPSAAHRASSTTHFESCHDGHQDNWRSVRG